MKRRRQESGFALLLVFLMAAVIAITLYMEIPRVAFDSQRQKEQLLIERGEQYKLAIRRFLQANPNRWPASMDELESFNNRRFLRHRYIDPMTGKDEWRLIHIQNGVLTDSKNNKPKTDQAKESNPNTFIQEQAGLGSVGTPGANAQSAWKNRRPSDDQAGNVPGGAAGAPQNPNNPNPVPGQAGAPPPVLGAPGTLVPGGTMAGQPGQPGQPGYPPMPGIGTMPPGVPAPPGAQPGGSGGFIVNQPGLGSIGTSSTTTGANGQPVYPGQQQYPGMPGMPAGPQPGGVQPYPTMPGAGVPPGYGQPGTTPGNQNQAIGLINNILTSPRPGGLAGIQGGPGPGQPGGMAPGQFGQQGAAGPVTVGGFGGTVGAQGTMGAPGTPGTPIGSPIGGAGGMTIGGGIAGVASTLDSDSIMVYNDHTNYSEWEFVFDPTKWHAPPNPSQGTIGTSAAQLGSSANNLNSGIAGSGASATTGFSSGVGGPGGFGSAPGGQQAGGPGGFGSAPGGQQAGGPGGQVPGGQMGTGGMGGSSAFGGGGLPDIRPGRK